MLIIHSVTFLSILAQDAVALPLAQSFPANEIRYIIENSKAAILLSTTKFQDKAHEVLDSDEISHKPILKISEKIEAGSESTEPIKLEATSDDKGGFMLYTSGTTSRPKGVVLSTSVLAAQANSLIEAWNYTPSDHLLHVLPLHHIHGTVNALITPLVAGSSIEFLFPFNATSVWHRFAAPFLPTNGSKPIPITFFTVVPTIYTRLLSTHADLPPDIQSASKTGISPPHLRLNISGSAALPTPTKSAWSTLSSGNILLERYGMTEVGMALSCGLAFSDRIDGSVGWPLPSVQARLVDTDTNEVIPSDSSDPEREGEIQLRGPTIFSSYWRNPSATSSEFTSSPDDDGHGPWFKTGDVAVRASIPSSGTNPAQPWAHGPLFFIRGRRSVDIIKTGGEKVSALEIERELLSLPQIAEAAVVGLPSEQWGQKVAAVVVLSSDGETAGKGGKQWSAMDMRRALKERLVNYKIPQELKVVEAIPRNAMGKINKKELVKDVFG